MCLLTCARNYLGVVLLISCFTSVSNTLVSSSSSISENDGCKLSLNSGEIIDLSPLLNSKQPLIASTTTSLYIYHPCQDIPLNSKEVNECQKKYGLCYFTPKEALDKPINLDKVLKNETVGKFTLLAYSEDAVFRENRLKQPEIVYKLTKNETVTITSYIRLECDEKVDSYKLVITKTSVQEHALTLSSKYVCLQTAHYMSGGTVFFIILVVFVTLYFLGGILVLKFIRGATGIEMIPNHEFWCSLPELAKNGFKYLTSCGKNTPDSYEKI